jgi:hypothetical protein
MTHGRIGRAVVKAAAYTLATIAGFAVGVIVGLYIADVHEHDQSMAALLVAMDCSRKQTDLSVCVQIANAAVALNPKDYRPAYFLGRLYERIGAPGLAATMYRAALNIIDQAAGQGTMGANTVEAADKANIETDLRRVELPGGQKP